VMRRAPGDFGGVAGKSPGAQAWMKTGGVHACRESWLARFRRRYPRCS
jgi:hypothetical protein